MSEFFKRLFITLSACLGGFVFCFFLGKIAPPAAVGVAIIGCVILAFIFIKVYLFRA